MTDFIEQALQSQLAQAQRAAQSGAQNLLQPPQGGLTPDQRLQIMAGGLANPLVRAGDRRSSSAQGAGRDFRVRISPLNPGEVYGGSGLLDILRSSKDGTNGMMFPYTPSVQFSQSVEYDPMVLPHTNADLVTYKNTPLVEISISGKFSVQNQREGEYAMACLHFLRVVSKMHFGESAGSFAGLPPPILVLNGYGTYMFNNLKCVLRSHNWTFDEQQEMVPINIRGQTVRLPPLFSLSVTLKVQQTPMAMRKEFNLNEFRTGALMQRGGWI